MMTLSAMIFGSLLLQPSSGTAANLVTKIVSIENRTWVAAEQLISLPRITEDQQKALAKRLQIDPLRVIPLDVAYGGHAVSRSGQISPAQVRLVFLSLSPHHTSEAKPIAFTRILAMKDGESLAILDLGDEAADVLETNLIYNPQIQLNFRRVDQMPRTLARKFRRLLKQLEPHLKTSEEEPLRLTFEFTFEDRATQLAPWTTTTEQTTDALDWLSPPSVCDRVLEFKKSLPGWMRLKI